MPARAYRRRVAPRPDPGPSQSFVSAQTRLVSDQASTRSLRVGPAPRCCVRSWIQLPTLYDHQRQAFFHCSASGTISSSPAVFLVCVGGMRHQPHFCRWPGMWTCPGSDHGQSEFPHTVRTAMRRMTSYSVILRAAIASSRDYMLVIKILFARDPWSEFEVVYS